jgi:hypothetical protein
MRLERIQASKRRLLPQTIGSLLVLGLLGPQQTRAGEVVSQLETLRGQSSIAVRAEVDGIRDLSEASLRSDVETALRGAGITILPDGPEATPVLVLKVDALTARMGGVFQTVYALALEFRRLLPVNEQHSNRLMQATTWSNGSLGTVPAVEAMSIRGEANALVRKFLDAFARAQIAGNVGTGGDKAGGAMATLTPLASNIDFSGFASPGLAEAFEKDRIQFLLEEKRKAALYAWGISRYINGDTGSEVIGCSQSQDMALRSSLSRLVRQLTVNSGGGQTGMLRTMSNLEDQHTISAGTQDISHFVKDYGGCSGEITSRFLSTYRHFVKSAAQ